jgi:transcriptional regulator with XRE-family HTH domain
MKEKEKTEKILRNIRQSLENLDIGNEIRLIMEANKFSHHYLANIINCHRSNIAKILKRKNNLDLEQLILISAALNHNFLDTICNLLRTDQENILLDRCFIDITPSTVQIIRQNNQSPIITFRREEE